MHGFVNPPCRIKARPATCQGFPGSPTTLAKRNLQRSLAGSTTGSSQPGKQSGGAGRDDASSRASRASMSSTIGSTVGSGKRSAAGAGPRARSASPKRSSCLDASDEAVRESAKVALQKYRVAFELMRRRDKSRSCSGWTDDDSPTKARGAKQSSPFSPLGTGGGAAGKAENET